MQAQPVAVLELLQSPEWRYATRPQQALKLQEQVGCLQYDMHQRGGHLQHVSVMVHKATACQAIICCFTMQENGYA